MDVIHEALQVNNVLDIQILQTLGRWALRDVLADDRAEVQPDELRRLWYKLQRTACSYRVVDQHLSAACNAVCVFLRCAKQNQDEQVRKFAYSKATWIEGFDIVHKAFNCGKPKPALQVLETLLQILHDDPDQNSAKLTAFLAISEMVKIVVTAQPEIRLKEACTVLHCFLRRLPKIVELSGYCTGLEQSTMTTFRQRCSNHQISTSMIDSDTTPTLDVLFLSLLLAIDVLETRTVALKLFSYACSRGTNHDYLENVARASHMIQVYLTANTKSLAEFSINVFPAVLRTAFQFEAYLQQYAPTSNTTTFELEIYLAILEVGRRQGHINEQDVANNLYRVIFHDVVDGQRKIGGWAGFCTLLAHRKPVLRLRTYSLLTISHETNRQVDAGVLECLQASFRSLHDDSDAYYRDVFVSISRRLLGRIVGSTQATQRGLQGQKQDNLAEPIVVRYQQFIYAYVKFLITELGPHVSYSRHNLALQMIEHILEHNLFVHIDSDSTDIVSNLTKTLLNLMLDPFEDIRALSSKILATLIRQDYTSVSAEFTARNMLNRTQHLSAQTNRGDHADALGRVCMLQGLITLRDTNNNEKSSLSMLPKSTLEGLVTGLRLHMASNRSLHPTTLFPVHGTLLGIAYSLSESHLAASSTSEEVVSEILGICSTIWLSVQAELCIDSPERTTDNDDQDESAGPKDLLAYSWRALRDSSIVLQALLNAPLTSKVALCKAVGKLCLEQLTMLRHRGAFSTVAQTFVLCCQAARSCKDPELHTELDTWQSSALLEIDHQSTTLTRRSAGLPAMFAALLDPNDSSAFILLIEKLERMAAMPVDLTNHDSTESIIKLPQVHALNCIRELMLNSRFRTVTEPIVVTMLNLSARSLGSDIWAVRNCGLMLFRACISRLTSETSMASTTENKSASHSDNVTPLQLAVNLLGNPHNDASDSNSRPEIVFAALDLLGRLPVHSGTINELNHLYEQQLGNSLWSIREYAARLRALTTPSGQERPVFMSVVRLMTAPSRLSVSNNLLHGRLLCGRLVLQPCWSSVGQWSLKERTARLIASLHTHVRNTLERGFNAYVIAALLDIINDAYAAYLKQRLDCTEVEQCSDLIQSGHLEWVSNHSHFLLRRALQLNAVYKMFWTEVKSESTDYDASPSASDNRIKLYHDVADPDVVLFVLNELAEFPAHLLPSCTTSLYIDTIVSNASQEIRAAAIRGLFHCLQSASTKLSESQVQSLMTTFEFRECCSRELFGAQMMLAGSLIPDIIRTTWNKPSSLIAQLVNSLQQSLLDEIEATTRMSALMVIQAIQSYLLSGAVCGLSFTEPDRIRVLLMLYDCLNDDEEDIREAATAIASSLVASRTQQKTAIPGCAAATRQALQELLFDDFNDSTLLMARACGKIMGAAAILIPDEVESINDHCKINSVMTMIKIATRTASELFAEEKQNLYIDEVSEISAWALRLKTCRIENLVSISDGTVYVMPNICSWTISGIQEMVNLVVSNPTRNEAFGPMGPTYNEDILIIFMRVLTTAQVVLHRVHEAKQTTTNQKTNSGFIAASNVDSLIDELRTLQSACRQHDAHDLVVKAIDAALSKR